MNACSEPASSTASRLSTVQGLSLTPGAYTTNAWYGSDAFQQTFLSAWGVK